LVVTNFSQPRFADRQSRQRKMERLAPSTT
jgi:hypothetical protein